MAAAAASLSAACLRVKSATHPMAKVTMLILDDLGISQYFLKVQLPNKNAEVSTPLG